MKTIITFYLLALSTICIAQQKLDITIIGTAHYFQDEYQPLQNFKKVEDFIVDLNPEIICIEAIPVDDTLSLQEIWPNTIKRADRLRDSLIQQGAYASNFEVLKSDTENEFWNTYQGKDLLLKGANHYASYDLWNAYYQWFQVEQAGDSLYYFSRFQRKLKNSEYGLMIYPAAQRLGVKQFYGIDYRDGEAEFLANNKSVLKKLLFKLKWKPLKIYLKTQKKYRKAEEEGKLLEFINGPEFQNSFSTLIDEIPRRLPKSAEAKQVKAYWLKRNKIMAARTIQVAEEQGAQKILLTVGSAHVTHLQRFLEAEGHTVTTYGQIINTIND